ncbi:lin-54 protein-like [Scleropages formosus]|uniref:Lin-54 protein-like n=1 Tax=Scleropages formosus TaxID=113540 RepID=A0A0P7V1L2_SCLFO|nr:lin-54 protein-like [Scleropages formosus]
MDVVSPELNSILPDEIMDTEAIVIEEELPADATVPLAQVELPTPVPMETELPEIVNLSSAGTPMQRTQALTTSTSTDSSHCSMGSGTQLLLTASVAPRPATPAVSKSTSPGVSGGLQRLTTPFAIQGNHQIILNKVSATASSDEKSPSPHVLKQEGQKLVVTGLSKSGQPIVLALPHTNPKPGSAQATGDAKAQTQQFKVVTIGGRPDLKPVVGVQAVSTASQLLGTTQQSTLQTQQLKTVQIAKKTQASSSGPMITKFIITKPLNSKGVSGQTSVSPVITGRVIPQNTPGTPPRTISISETSAVQTVSSSKVPISPLKSPSKLTVVSVASQSPSSPQKSVALPINVALGQQILAVQQSTATSPAKGVSNSSTPQTMKPVQTVAVGGVGTPQFKTIFPLTTPPNVQQIQVPGSRFHYVRLVTATTGSGVTATASTSTNSPAIQPAAKPMVVNTAAMRMSVPIVPAQSMKQVVPKPLTSSAPQVATSSQTQQRLIMPATPLPQIQPNLTNLPPGTVLAPAPGAGNVGYAVLPAQYVTQLPQSTFVTLASSSSSFSTPTGIQTQARLSLNGYCDCFANGEFCNNCNCTNCFNNLEHETERLKAIKACLDRNPEAFKPKIGKGKEGESDRRHSKGCNCKRSGCLKNYCECYEAKIMCSSICKCVGCKNFEESPERKTLMHLADAAEEVAEATCDCLMEQAEQAELTDQPHAVAERMILEEFGRCLMRIISSAGQAKADCSINC